MILARRHALLLVTLLALALGTTALNVSPPSATAQDESGQLATWRVYVDNREDAQSLLTNGYDVMEAAGDGYLLVLGESSVADEIRASGLQVEFDSALDPVPQPPPQARTYYNGYRTTDEHNAHLVDVAATYPDLATLYDYGDSWNKANGRPGGNDLFVICLTAKQAGDCALDPAAPKPRAVIMAAIHARELQTSEIAWRLVDELTEQYGVDADITHLMDTTETWIIPIANPDGREIVETGGNNPYLQRKNANDTVGNCQRPPTSSNHHGVDLNRNASTLDWAQIGVSSNPCSQAYPGTSPASEPEMTGLETLFSQLWPDQKGAISQPAPSDATGTFITIHSYGDLVMLPEGMGTVTEAPNDAELRAYAFRMSHFNGYRTGTGEEILYGASGVTDAWTYYELGIASTTYEISPRSGVGPCSGFTPAYGCIDSILWPQNRDALLYSVRVANSPYLTSQGPTTLQVELDASTVTQGETLSVSAAVDDDALGTAPGSFDRPAPRAITAVEYYIDASDLQGGTPTAMQPADGSFNQTEESAIASIPTTDLAPGRHTLFVRGRNATGFWGPVQPVFFEVLPDAPSSEVNRLQPTVTCLAGNGRIDLNVVNDSASPVTYVLEIGSLSPRQATVPPASWWRSPVTGRPDGDLQVTLTGNGVVLVDEMVTVACDAAAQVSPSGVQWFTWCIDGRGMIFAQMSNQSSTATSYILDVEGLRRSTTAAAYGAAFRGVSGRSDGDYTAHVEVAGTVIDSAQVTVACGAD